VVFEFGMPGAIYGLIQANDGGFAAQVTDIG
jgi:predicted XRE-type DNA-binding protein